MEQYFEVSSQMVVAIMNEIVKHHPDVSLKCLLEDVYGTSQIQQVVKEKIMCYVDANHSVNYNALVDLFPKNVANTSIIQTLLAELEQEQRIAIKQSQIIPIYPSVLDYINKTYEGSILDILLHRLNGETLASIGTMFDVSKERIGQIIERELKTFPKTREEQYLYYVQQYDFTNEIFQKGFGEPKTTYHYLLLLTKGGKKAMCEAIDDEHIDEKIRERIEQVFYEECFFQEGVHTKKTLIDFERYYIRNYCSKSMHFQEYCEKLKHFLREHQWEDCSKIGTKSHEHRLIQYRNVVWKNKHFRYYDVKYMNVDAFLEALALEQYHDVTLSACIIYQDHEEVMKRFDIQDEYELHNLLKKIVVEKGITGIVFGRTPSITFTKVNA